MTHLGVSKAVNIGYEYAREYCEQNNIFYDFIWTIDGDQVLEPDVCGGINLHIERDGTIGAASGQVYNPDGTPDIYPDGELPNKRVYRREAIESIGGFPVTTYSYDTVILAKLRMDRWGIKSFPEYTILNLRADSGIERDGWKSSVQFGKARYYLGYSFLLLVMGCGYLVSQKKVKKAAGVFWGYLTSWMSRAEVIEDKAVWNHFHNERIDEILSKVYIYPRHIVIVTILAATIIAVLAIWRLTA